MDLSCNDELMQACTRFSIDYSVIVIKIDGVIPADKREQLEFHLQRFALKLGVGTHKKEWVYTDFNEPFVVIITFKVELDVGNVTPRANRIEMFINEVCEYKHTTYEDVKQTIRKREVVQIRQLLMYFLKEKSILSLRAIGNLFNGKDHATVVHAHKAITTLMESEKATRDEVEYIKNNIANKYF